MAWYRLNISKKQYEMGHLGLITDKVAAIRASGKMPEGSNVFLGKETVERLPLYFTPDAGNWAAEILEKFKASPCERPPQAELTRNIMGQKVDPASLPED